MSVVDGSYRLVLAYVLQYHCHLALTRLLRLCLALIRLGDSSNFEALLSLDVFVFVLLRRFASDSILHTMQFFGQESSAAF